MSMVVEYQIKNTVYVAKIWGWESHDQKLRVDETQQFLVGLLGATTPTITTLSIIIKCLFARLNINDIQHNDTQYGVL